MLPRSGRPPTQSASCHPSRALQHHHPAPAAGGDLTDATMTSSASSSADAALPGYQVQLSDSGVEHSVTKLDNCAASLRSFLCSTDTADRYPQQHDLPIHTSPCLREEDTLSYRCRCTFQLICTADVNELEYAMRVKNKPVPINATSFPIATQRIQVAMASFLELINRQAESSSILLASRPASISFDSSWDGQDCTATINYTDHLPDKEASWRAEADKLRRTCMLTCFTGRSKKRKLISSDGDAEIETYINDTITILTSDHDGSIISVDVGGWAPTQTTDISHYSISYMKPEDAFQHPCGNAMKTALTWMLKRICAISGEIKDGANSKIGMLEMYCGFGAHTIPIAKLALVDFYAAVELDERLIKACQRNCRLNEINAEFCSNVNVANEVSPKSKTPTVHLFHGDAGLWAMKARHRRHQLQRSPTSTDNCETDVPSLSWYDQDYKILLVDPPRAGLDDNVCRMAIEGPFQHLIYISCGKDALLRDLKVLDCSFELVDCTLIDLFPRTDAIESLVHLRRRKRN